MSKLLIVPPLPATLASVSGGTGAPNLLTPDPKEVWAGASAGGVEGSIVLDLGAPRSVDTVFLGFVQMAVYEATWRVTGGVANQSEITLQPETTLRVPDVAGQVTEPAHALWFGEPATVRYIQISVKTTSSNPLSIGRALVGKAFIAGLGQEWGFGRRPIDTGTATSLSSGGFSVVEGAKKVGATWTFGDLSVAEADQLEAIALQLGGTTPALVIENADRVPGLRARIRYGLFKWRAFERRNRAQTKWEMEIEDWV